MFCYANSNLRKEQQNDEILRFVEFWKERTGRLPQELVFDSKLTTYANLNELNNMDIDFITLRRRSDKILEQLRQTPGSAWRQIQLSNVSRAFRTPKVLERMIQLRDYEVPIGQLAIRDLGHEPTLLLTNQLRRSATKLIDRYAQRMLIENGIADGVFVAHTAWGEISFASDAPEARARIREDIQTAIEVQERVSAKWCTVVPESTIAASHGSIRPPMWSTT